MVETAAHLVENVLPDVPIRQYVLSPPFELRGLLASKSDALSKLARTFVRAVFGRMKRWARANELADPQCGAVLFIQRFTKTLTVAPHLHVLVLDGVFVKDREDAGPRFVDLPAPTTTELEEIVRTVCETMMRFLKRKGFIGNDPEAEQELTPADRWFLKGAAEPSGLGPVPTAPQPSGVNDRGFSVHATVTVARGDTKGREQLCRYVARPPFAQEQLRTCADGRVELTLRRPARNGQTSIRLQPLQLMKRLAWLVPPPGRHQIRYCGVLAPAAKMRCEVVPRPAPKLQLVFPIENMRPSTPSFRPTWSRLIARVYDLDAERCPKCSGRLRPIGAVTDPIEALRHIQRLDAERARGPPQLSLAL